MSFWRELHREVQTTFGRRRATGGAASHTRVVRAPAGVQGLVVQEDESGSGWDIIERKVQEPPVAYTERCSLASSQYLVGGEEGAADEEDAEYRRIWNLPLRACGIGGTSSSPSQGPRVPSSAVGGVDAACTAKSSRSSATVSTSPSAAEGALEVMIPSAPSTAPVQLASDHTPRADLPNLRAASCQSASESSPASCAREHGNVAALEALSTLPLPPSTMLLAAAGAPGAGTSTDRAAAGAAVVPANLACGAQQTGIATCTSAATGVVGSPGSDRRDDGHHAAAASSAHAVTSARVDQDGALPSLPLGAHDEPCLPQPASQSTPENLQQSGRRGSSCMLIVKVLQWFCSLMIGSVRWGCTMAVHSTLGLLQAHHPGLTLLHLLRNVHSRKCVMQCMMLNLLLFRGALYIYESVLPAFCLSVLGVRLMGDWRYELAIVALWAAPAYVICEIVTTSLHFKMAQKMLNEAPFVSPPSTRLHTAGSNAAPVAGASGQHDGGLTTVPAACSAAAVMDSDRLNGGRAGYCSDGGADGGNAEVGTREEDGQRDAMLSFTSIVYTRLIYIVFVLQVRSAQRAAHFACPMPRRPSHPCVRARAGGRSASFAACLSSGRC